MQTIALSELAVAVLRFYRKDDSTPTGDRELAAYRELVETGIMEPMPGSEQAYRLTDGGKEHREAIVEREQERIERGRHAPPDLSRLSDRAWGLLHRIASGEEVEVTPETRPLFRELAEARIVLVINTFAGGPESAWRWTYWGWKRKPEWVEIACAKAAG